jgi:O-methyltransferase involved in polyketide biosynthesis
MLKLAPTSALVLKWSKGLCYNSELSKKYLEMLDLSAGEETFNECNRVCDFYPEIIINRKYSVWELIKYSLNENKSIKQIIVLAAGLAPLSLDVHTNYPDIDVFDVDIDLMKEKQELYNKICDNKKIRFIECDITDTVNLLNLLVKKGWSPNLNSLIIYEGISYYLKKQQTKEIFQNLTSSADNSLIIADVLPPTERIEESRRQFPQRFFEIVCKKCDIPEETRFDHREIIEFLEFEIVKMFNMRTSELLRTGSNKYFLTDESSWRDVVLLKRKS